MCVCVCLYVCVCVCICLCVSLNIILIKFQFSICMVIDKPEDLLQDYGRVMHWDQRLPPGCQYASLRNIQREQRDTHRKMAIPKKRFVR